MSDNEVRNTIDDIVHVSVSENDLHGGLGIMMRRKGKLMGVMIYVKFWIYTWFYLWLNDYPNGREMTSAWANLTLNINEKMRNYE